MTGLDWVGVIVGVGGFTLVWGVVSGGMTHFRTAMSVIVIVVIVTFVELGLPIGEPAWDFLANHRISS
ncbi:hypothetical protein [Parafrankia sp. EUN1f]|uniref:hypothetical protein n=1 Tax=Parafrankia sp. EUN1f TaxID=102897 RepID=UPI0001C452FA|nr:hypothetical protein [Parafrankia sp. EUN1f]EFC79001.1 hypothetical protein FrEUN1fDRAFT_7883 [Parafrankia sp. EUN1f]